MNPNNKSLRRFAARITAVAVLAGAGAFAVAAPASAHMSYQMYGEKPYAGKGAVIFARIGHAEPGLSTVKVEVAIPEGVTSVKPQHISGWTESTTMTADGKNVATVSWSGGSVADASFADFGIKLTFPKTPGATLYFKSVQTLSDGSTLAWIEIPVEGAAEPAHPAPKIVLLDPALDPAAGATASASSAKTAADAAKVAADLATAAAKSAVEAVTGIKSYSGEISGTVSMKTKKVRIVADASTTHAGKSYVVRTVDANGKSVDIISGKLDARGDVIKTVAMSRTGKAAYQLKAGSKLSLVVAGKVLATADVA